MGGQSQLIFYDNEALADLEGALGMRSSPVWKVLLFMDSFLKIAKLATGALPFIKAGTCRLQHSLIMMNINENFSCYHIKQHELHNRPSKSDTVQVMK